MKKKIIAVILTLCLGIAALLVFAGCDEMSQEQVNTETAMQGSAHIIENQPAPTDLDYSLERYNVIKRAYWVNGQREKAMSLPCPVEKPLGYIVLLSASGAVMGRFVVDGKVSSLNSYLFPAEYPQHVHNYGDDGNSGHCYYDLVEVAGIDGCYGENVSGIFFFTPDGKYIEWTGDFLYSDIPFTVDDPILKTEGDES